MKKRIILLVFTPILLILLAVSCKTTPETTTTTRGGENPQPVFQDQAFFDEIKNVENARKRAEDFESPAYFPSDWDAAESHFASARNMPHSTDTELQQAVASLKLCADEYNGLFGKAVPLYAQAREDEIMSERETLIGTGFTKTFPEYLKKADDIALDALSQYEAEDYYKARDTAAQALSEYQLLNLGAKAYVTRQRIIDFELAAYDPNNFDKAEEIALSAYNEYEAGHNAQSREYIDEALIRYNLVLENSLVGYASSKRDISTAERQRALSLKANIAARDLYREAEAIYLQAESALEAERYDEAASLFTEAEARFMIASMETMEKQRIAEEAIREAEERIEESDEAVKNAVIVIEGGSR